MKLPNLFGRKLSSGDVPTPRESESCLVVRAIMAAPLPNQAVALMTVAMQHQDWLVRDRTLTACVKVMTQRRHQNLDTQAICRVLCTSMTDEVPRVRESALEAMAGLSAYMGKAELLQMVHASTGINDKVKQLIRDRLEDPSPPFANKQDGFDLPTMEPPSRAPSPDPLLPGVEPPRHSAPSPRLLSGLAKLLPGRRVSEAAAPAPPPRRTTDPDRAADGWLHLGRFMVSRSGAIRSCGGSAVFDPMHNPAANVTLSKPAPGSFSGTSRNYHAIEEPMSPHTPSLQPHLPINPRDPKHAAPAPVKRRYLSDMGHAPLQMSDPDLVLDTNEFSPMSMLLSTPSDDWSETPVNPTNPFRRRLVTDPGFSMSPSALDASDYSHKLPSVSKQPSGARSRDWAGIGSKDSIEEEGQHGTRLAEATVKLAGLSRFHSSALPSDGSVPVSREASLHQLKRIQQEKWGLMSPKPPQPRQKSGSPKRPPPGDIHTVHTQEQPQAPPLPQATNSFSGFGSLIICLPEIKVREERKLQDQQQQRQQQQQQVPPQASPPARSIRKWGSFSGHEAVDAASPMLPRGAAKPVPLATGGAGSVDRSEVVLFENLMPLSGPESVLRASLTVMQAANTADRKQLDWQGQNEALNNCRRLIKHHPTVVAPAIAEVVAATVPAIDALRSLTAKTALVLYQELFSQLGRTADHHLGTIVPMLLKRAAEVSIAGRENFLTLEARSALVEMCHNVSGPRAMTALMSGARHKAPNVRACAAQHLDLMVELACKGLGAWAAPTSNWGFLERLLATAVGLLDEGALETRIHGKRVIWNLKQLLGPDEIASLVAQQQLQPMAQKKLQELVDSLQEQPPLPKSNIISSAAAAQPGTRFRKLRTQVSLPGSFCMPAQSSVPVPVGPPSAPVPPGIPRPNPRSHSGCSIRTGSSSKPRGNAADGVSAGAAPAPTVHSPRNAKGTAAAAEPSVLSRAVQGLGAKEFQKRVEGLRQLESIIPMITASSDAQLTQVLDAVKDRLTEGNSKVNIQALGSLAVLFEALRERISPFLNTLLPAMAACLGSGNAQIRSAASIALDKLCTSLPPSSLLQNLCHCVASGLLRSRTALVDKLEVIIDAIYLTRPQLVHRYAVPAAISLANDNKGGTETKTAATRLLSALARNMGPQLLECTPGASLVVKQRLVEIVAAVQRHDDNEKSGP